MLPLAFILPAISLMLLPTTLLIMVEPELACLKFTVAAEPILNVFQLIWAVAFVVSWVTVITGAAIVPPFVTVLVPKTLALSTLGNAVLTGAAYAIPVMPNNKPRVTPCANLLNFICLLITHTSDLMHLSEALRS